MSTQQDIYAAGFENRPPMLNKENYVPWSSRLLRYAKSRPNGKLIYNSIINDDELTEKELKQIEADDQAIQTILLSLPKDIYADVDSCETAQEIYASPRSTSFNQNYMQQPMPNPEDITDLTTAMNMALAIMAKAFKLNYLTPTNNNQRISSNPRNKQIAQLGMNMGQDRKMQMVGDNDENQFRQYAGQNVGNLNGYNDVQNVENHVIQNVVQNPRVQNIGNQNGLIGVPRNANHNLNGNEEWVILLKTALSDQGEGMLLTFRLNLDEIEEVNANCILMANLQQASTSGTQIDKALVYDSDGSAEFTELLKPILESHQEPQNDNNVISELTSVKQSGGTVEQHPTNVKETRVLYDSLNHNLAVEVEKVNTLEWSRHVTIVHQTKDLHTADYTQLYDFLKYNQKENQIGNGNLVAVYGEGNAAGHNGNQIRCYNCRGVGHFARDCTVRPRRRDAAYLQTQLLIAQKEEAGIQLQAEEYDLMAAAADLDEIEEVNANCISMANLQQASSSSTQTDSTPVYDSDRSAK
nr:hypothetical protein [Tanacetum cinerariifolium]